MKNLRSWRSGLFLVLLVGAVSALRSQGPDMPDIPLSACNPVCPGVGKVRAFEGLRGESLKYDGYIFSVSPNEEWIVAFGLGSDVRVSHIPTGKTWTGRTPALEYGQQDWHANCFSRDGNQLFYSRYVVALTPGMSALGFRPVDHPAPGYLLGDTTRPPDPDGQGKAAWSADRRVGCEAVGDQVRITPPGKLQTIDFSEPDRGEREDTEQVLKSMEGLLSQVAKEQGKEKAEEGRKAFRDLAQETSRWPRELKQLAVSPDGRYLAAIAEKSENGYFPSSEGLLISLRHQPPVAHRFAVNVFSKIFWAAHGSRIYFYAQPTSNEGNGTIYQLDFKDF